MKYIHLKHFNNRTAATPQEIIQLHTLLSMLLHSTLDKIQTQVDTMTESELPTKNKIASNNGSAVFTIDMRLDKFFSVDKTVLTKRCEA